MAKMTQERLDAYLRREAWLNNLDRQNKAKAHKKRLNTVLIAGLKMVTCGINSKPHVVRRDCVNPNPAFYKLPKGWRWLRLGEWVREGDYCCDPRTKPVRIIVNRAWKMTPRNHPVRRKIQVKGNRK